MTPAGRAGSGMRARVEAQVRSIRGATPAESVLPDGHHRAPPSNSSGRLGALAVGVAAVVVGVIAFGWVLAARPNAVPIAPKGTSSAVPSPGVASPAPSGTAEASPPSNLVVDVAGKVRRPGLYRLPPGARVDDAVRAAGGALPGVSLATLNLAARLVDGQQVPVGVPAALPPPIAGGDAARASVGLVDLNAATVDQLDALPGVGPVLAQQIVGWRTAHGRFTSIDQLTEVPGIGSAKLATLRPLVTV